MVTRLSAPARRDQLLAVALEAFARQGFHDTSMNDVAEAAGVTKPVLYQHFGSKRELYLELLSAVGDGLLDALDAATGRAETPHEKVERGFATYFRWVAEDHDAFVLLFGGGARHDAEFSAAVRTIEAAIAAYIAPMIEADIDPDHQRTLAYALVGLAEGTSRHLVDRGTPFDPDRLARRVADLAWGGLRSVRRR